MTGDGTGDWTIKRGCSVVLAGGLEEAWTEAGQGSEALELNGLAVGHGPLQGVTGRGAHGTQPRGFPLCHSPAPQTASKFLCPRFTISAAPVLLGYAPILEGGALCLTDLLFHHSTPTRAALAPPSEQ